MLCEMKSRPGFELVSPCPFPTTKAITPRAPSISKTSCLTKAEELSQLYYLPIAEGRIIGFIPLHKGISAM